MRRALALLALAATIATPAAAQQRCLTQPEAEAVTLVAMPAIIRDAGRVCAALPADSLLRRDSGAFIAKYDVAADRAWPDAKAALAKVSEPALAMLLASDYARPMLTSVVAPMITGHIQAADCPTLDRLVTLLEPLPARNTAGIVVATLQYLKAERAKGNMRGAPDLPVCAVKP